MSRLLQPCLVTAVATLVLQGCHEPLRPVSTEAAARGMLAASTVPADPAGRHLVVFAAERVPADFGERVTRLGGSVETLLDSIGVAAVTGLSEGAAAELAATADVRAVELDAATAPPNEDVGADVATADAVVSELFASADATASPSAAQ